MLATGHGGPPSGYLSSETISSLSEINSEIIRNSRVRSRQAFEEDLSTSAASTSPRPPEEGYSRKRRRTNKPQIGTSSSTTNSAYSNRELHSLARPDGSTARAMRLTAEDDPESSIQSHSELSTGLEGLSGGSLGGIRPIHSDIIADPYAPGAQSHSTVSNDEAYPSAKNSHAKGLSNGSANGSATNGSLSPRIELYADSVVRRPMAIARVNPPGTTLYPESATNREEFVRLVIQTMKDIGYLYVVCVFLIVHKLNSIQRDCCSS